MSSFIDYISLKEFTGSKYEVSINQFNEEVLVPTEEWLEYKKLKFLELRLKEANIPLHIINYNPNSQYIGLKSLDLVKKVNKYVDFFEEKFCNKCLYFYGPSGTQKTTVAQWIAKKIIEKGLKVSYVTMNNLLSVLTQENFSEESKRIIEIYKQSDLLILDRAFDKSQVTVYASGYQLSFLDSFLRERLEVSQKAIILISNNPLEDISKHKFNEDLQDLIYRYVIPIQGALYFQDSYKQKENFDLTTIWDD